jgi:cellulose synthase/poly-beta-1,6-N-acetylglucosamine synthase-like glycosyltransferase/beta-mannanase
MIYNKEIRPPKRQERITLRIMIILGVFSFAYFFYWFLNPGYIENRFLFWILIISMFFEAIKTLYIWYHYWDISVPEKPLAASKLSVDVFTTFFPGEPYSMVKETLLAIQKIRYPHTTYLCDEANDEHLIDFCKKNNIIHVTRNNRINAKAGNINNALKQASGDLCLILDPDHVPFDNFLDEVVPYFEDESIGFVQTVQAYYNIKESEVAKGAAEQTFHFYGPVMMTMNSYGTVNAIGANCVFRRVALDSIGGHAPGLSEDMHTAMKLHAKGWRSIYLPKVLAKGLSPASLTSYYKQQLKWSRGTLELLFAEYPKLFKKFSWRQKIHYGILPSYYLSGVICLINFLIPIISLFIASTPWKGNILDFGLIFAPIFICILGIRFYVQKWVMYKSERGLHVTGGILQICTWWINLIGLVYTIFRKNVPYLPTPKEDKESTSWKILIPNLVVGILSIIAVIYGLSIDFTPFSIFMSGFAILNAGFMFYTILFAFQKQKVITFKSDQEDIKNSGFNHIQNFIFHFWRKAAFPVILVVLSVTLLLHNKIEYRKWGGVTPEVQGKHIINYLGIFAPKTDNGITNLKSVKEISQKIGEDFDIISLYLPWEKSLESKFPQLLIDSIYSQKSIPMITWEPWLNSFMHDLQRDKKEDKHVLELIEEGYFDDYISSFSMKLKNLNRPVFLRFAHEFDNPFYPWFSDREDASAIFKKAWIHAYEIFQRHGATNVIWIWNPWKTTSVMSFYPGSEYVDWIGVDILNYGKFNQDGKWYEFESLYKPFHDEFAKLPLTPVIISEFGSLNDDQKQGIWLKNAIDEIRSDFNEIKSIVYFNSKVDNNLPKGSQKEEKLDWKINDDRLIKNAFINTEVPKYVFSYLPEIKTEAKTIGSVNNYDLANVKGINLKKGRDWRKDYHVLSRANLLTSFRQMKNIGINTVKFEWNSIYRYNILKITKELNLNVSYGFWIPEDIDFLNDTLLTGQLKRSILDEVSNRKQYLHIISWNIQNDVLYNQKNFYHKPELLFQNRAYIIWLKDLIQEMKKIDSSRPIIVDLEVNPQSFDHSRMILDHINGVDFLGLVVKEDEELNPLIADLNNKHTNYVFSEIDVKVLTKPEVFKYQNPFFITAWQDQHESNKLTFEGITDRKGRFKPEYFELANSLKGSKLKNKIPIVKILRPATLIFDNMELDYQAMYYDTVQGWKPGGEIKDLKFEWSLVKCDEFGHFLAIKDVGKSSVLSLKIPEDHDLYRLLLTTIKGDLITTSLTTLNIPFEAKE